MSINGGNYMNAIEIKDLVKTFGDKSALKGLNMTVPAGAIYGFIGENGSGKSTTQKLICGLLTLTSGDIKLFGEDYTKESARDSLGCLIEAPGCYPNCSVWNNMLIQAANLGLKKPKEEIKRILKLVRMEGAASNKYKNCSLGMKQRVGIAIALLGNPRLLILDEPINGLDADGMRIMRDILTDLTKNHGCSVVISSHILGELEKIATHYGIIRGGRMIKEMTSTELEKDCPIYVLIKTCDNSKTKQLLNLKYSRVEEHNDELRIYDATKAEEVVSYLYANDVLVSEVETRKISLEEYYIELMKKKESEQNA